MTYEKTISENLAKIAGLNNTNNTNQFKTKVMKRKDLIESKEGITVVTCSNCNTLLKSKFKYSGTLYMDNDKISCMEGFKDKYGDTYDGCPKCNTDAYLMDI